MKAGHGRDPCRFFLIRCSPEGDYSVTNISKKIYTVFILSVLIYIDQLTKRLAVSHLKGQTAFPLIPDFLEFSYVENTGAAFSIFRGQQTFLLLLTGVIMLFLVIKYFQIPKHRHYLPMKISFLLIISGGIGNMIDRISLGYVVDFIYIVFINFPVFNLADCYVTIGMVLMTLTGIFLYEEQDIDFLFSLRRKSKKS